MKVQANREFKHALVVRPETLRKLATAAGVVGNLRLSADCADDVTREFPDIEALLQFENAKPKEFKRLRLSSRSDDFRSEVRIHVGGSVTTASLAVEGEEDFVSSIKDQAIDLIEGAKAWYWRMAKLDLGLGALILGLFVWMILSVMASSLPNQTTRVPIWRVVAIVAGLFLAAFGIMKVASAFSRLFEYCFPPVTFAVGQGADRYDVQDKVRWGVVLAFIVSVLASVVASLLFLM